MSYTAYYPAEPRPELDTVLWDLRMEVEIGEDMGQKPLGIEDFEMAGGRHFELARVFAAAADTALGN